jgi:hypothetical protein
MASFSESENVREKLVQLVDHVNRDLLKELRKEKLTRKGRTYHGTFIKRVLTDNRSLGREQVQSGSSLLAIQQQKKDTYTHVMQLLQHIAEKNGHISHEEFHQIAAKLLKYMNEFQEAFSEEMSVIDDSLEQTRTMNAELKKLEKIDSEVVRKACIKLEKEIGKYFRRDIRDSRSMRRRDRLHFKYKQVTDKKAMRLQELENYGFTGDPATRDFFLKNWTTFMEPLKLRCPPEQLHHLFESMVFEPMRLSGLLQKKHIEVILGVVQGISLNKPIAGNDKRVELTFRYILPFLAQIDLLSANLMDVKEYVVQMLQQPEASIARLNRVALHIRDSGQGPLPASKRDLREAVAKKQPWIVEERVVKGFYLH